MLRWPALPAELLVVPPVKKARQSLRLPSPTGGEQHAEPGRVLASLGASQDDPLLLAQRPGIDLGQGQARSHDHCH